MTASPTYYAAIAPGDTITVIFDGTTPDLVCDYQRLADNGNTIIAITPPGTAVDAPEAIVNYIDDFQYFYKGVPPAGASIAGEDIVGESVTVAFSNQGNADVTGTVLISDSINKILKLDVAGDDVYIPWTQIWTITVN